MRQKRRWLASRRVIWLALRIQPPRELTSAATIETAPDLGPYIELDRPTYASFAEQARRVPDRKLQAPDRPDLRAVAGLRGADRGAGSG